MKNNRNIILTYDYELFLGSDSGDLNTSLIDPTNKILDILNKHNAKGLFFIDSLFLIRLKETKCFNIVKQQIQHMVQQGHDIGLHIHPHWKAAKLIDDCRWRFEKYNNFRLHSFKDSEIKKIVKNCYSILSSIINEVDSNYKIDTFRAGGWSVQPFHKLKESFEEIGIKYDFSVLPFMSDNDKPKHCYDFEHVPNKEIWRFSDNVVIEDNSGKFIEIANTTYKMGIVDLIKNKNIIKTHKISGNGKGAGTKKSFIQQLKRVRFNVGQILSSDAIDIKIFKKYINKIQNNLLVSVSHPKLFSEDSFEVLEYKCQNFNCISYKKVEINE